MASFVVKSLVKSYLTATFFGKIYTKFIRRKVQGSFKRMNLFIIEPKFSRNIWYLRGFWWRVWRNSSFKTLWVWFSYGCCLQNSSQGTRSMVSVLDFEKIFSFFIRSRTNVRRVVKNGKRFQNMTRISLGQRNTLLSYTTTYQSRSLWVKLLIKKDEHI